MLALSVALAYLGTLGLLAFMRWLAARREVVEMAERALGAASLASTEAGKAQAALDSLTGRVRNLELKAGLTQRAG